MEILRQLPPQFHSKSPQQCGKTIYANGKVREMARDHEPNVQAAPMIVPKHKAKVVVLGDSGVGKTSIIYRHMLGTSYPPVNATIGASFVHCDVNAEDEDIRLQVWDTAGQERFRCMVPMYMRNADAALIVYDVTNGETFENVNRWLRDIERSCGTDDTKIYLIGNKTDMEDQREVSEAEGRAKAARMNANFIELSQEKMNLFSPLLNEIGQDILRQRLKSPLIIDDLDKKSKIRLDHGDSIDGREIGEMKIEKKSKCCSLL